MPKLKERTQTRVCKGMTLKEREEERMKKIYNMEAGEK